MRVVLPLPLNIANTGLHWGTKMRAHKEYNALCDQWQLCGFVVPRPPEVVPDRVTVQAHLYVHQTMDDDNATARLKWPVDWLVTRGYMPDDRHATIPTPEQTVDRNDQRVEIVITGE